VADSNAVRAGGAYVEVYAKNNVGPGLQAASKDITQFAASAKAGLTDTGQAAVKTEAGVKKFNKELSAKGLRHWAHGLEAPVKAASALVAALAVVGEAVHIFSGGRRDVEKFNEGLEKSADLAEKLADTLKKRSERGLEAAGKEGPFSSIAELTKQMNEAKKNLSGSEGGLGAARKKLEEMKEDTFLGIRVSDIPIVGRGWEMEEKAAEENVKVQKKAYETLMSSIDEYRHKIHELKNEIKKRYDEEKKQASEAAGRSYVGFREATDKLGMGSERASLYDIRSKLSAVGADPAASGSAAMAAIAFLRAKGQQELKDIDKDSYWQMRQAMLSVSGGVKGAFGANIGSGMFDFGVGGPLVGIGLTLKEMREIDLRKERLLADIDEQIKGIQGDYAQ